MPPLKFNYRTIPGKEITPRITSEQKSVLESQYINYVLNDDRVIISPHVEVLMSDDGTEVIRCILMADAIYG